MSANSKSDFELFQVADIPPPISEAVQHGIYPDISHDERARFNFEACLYKTIAKEISPGNALTYEKRVLPAFVKDHERPPTDRHEVRRAMNNDSIHNFWGGLRRNTMEMRQVNGQFVILRQLEKLAERALKYNKNSPNLSLNPTIETPPYVAEIDHHCMPGSYHRELCEGDVSPAANYDAGFFVTTGGSIGGLCDGAGEAIAGWLGEFDTDFKPKRILDIGCALGNSLVPIANTFPEADITAIDVSAPMLRYGHARAASLGITNINFVQMSGEDLSAFESGEFDLVMSSIFLHELSAKSLPRILREGTRVLKPGGIMLHLEQPQYSDDMPIFEQFIRDWDCYNNNEPFWSAMHEIDLVELMVELGFNRSSISHAAMRAKTALDKTGEKPAEDHGRGAAWHAYVARKDD